MLPEWKHSDVHVHLIRAVIAAAPEEASLEEMHREIHRLIRRSKTAEAFTVGLMLVLAEGVVYDKWPWLKRRKKK